MLHLVCHLIEHIVCMCKQYFNSSLVVGQQSDSDVAEHTYDLLFELNYIEPTVLLAVLPQLEFKLKVSVQMFCMVPNECGLYRVVT